MQKAGLNCMTAGPGFVADNWLLPETGLSGLLIGLAEMVDL